MQRCPSIRQYMADIVDPLLIGGATSLKRRPYILRSPLPPNRIQLCRHVKEQISTPSCCLMSVKTIVLEDGLDSGWPIWVQIKDYRFQVGFQDKVIQTIPTKACQVEYPWFPDALIGGRWPEVRDKRSTYSSAVAHPLHQLGVGGSQPKSHPHPGRSPVPTHSTNKKRSHTSEICSRHRCAWCYSNVFKGHSIRDPPHQTVHYVLRCWVGRAGPRSPTDTCCCYRVATAGVALRAPNPHPKQF